jgi:predicted nucleic acid-binding protein
LAPVIVDTNVVVAGLITARADAPTVRIVDGMLAAAFPFALSVALLAEYRLVLLRPRLRAAHGLAPAGVDRLLENIARHAIVLEPHPARARAPDAGDQHLWDLLETHAELRMVTGNARLLRASSMAGRLLAPADFVREW